MPGGKLCGAVKSNQYKSNKVYGFRNTVCPVEQVMSEIIELEDYYVRYYEEHFSD